MEKPHIGHIGIIVEDMNSAVDKLTGLLGVPPTGDKASGARAKNPSTATRRFTSSMWGLSPLFS